MYEVALFVKSGHHFDDLFVSDLQVRIVVAEVNVPQLGGRHTIAPDERHEQHMFLHAIKSYVQNNFLVSIHKY